MSLREQMTVGGNVGRVTERVAMPGETTQQRMDRIEMLLKNLESAYNEQVNKKTKEQYQQ